MCLQNELMQNGPPSVAQLAHEKKWWAVRNLIRRKLVHEKEMGEKFEGKDVIEWATHFGEERMAKELEYYIITVRRVFSCQIFSWLT